MSLSPKAMIVAFLFHSGDSHKLHDLLQLIEQLGGAKAHGALLVADRATPFHDCVKAKRLAERSFGRVLTIANVKSVTGWPQGANSLFFAAAHFIQGAWPEPWLLMETDCVPLCPGWLDALAKEYTGLDTFMGDLYDGLDSATGLPVKALSGVAVYPPNAATLLKDEPGKPWDMANRDILLRTGLPTPLIKHFYGQKDLPPTFVERKDTNSPRNAFTLSQIRPEAVLFHRCKDSSLIRLLRKKFHLPDPSPIVRLSKPTGTVDVVIRRSLAIGDCLGASFLADQLASQGKTVAWQAQPYCHAPLLACPSIASVGEVNGTIPHIDLDGAYETDPLQKSRHFAVSFHLRAVQQLQRFGHQLPPCRNFAPRIYHTPTEAILKRLEPHPHPWIMVGPRSNGFITRTVPDTLLAITATKLPGTCFWVGNHGPAPKPIVDLQCRSVEQVMDALAACDFFIGADSGPMHIAAALQKPMVVVRQGSNPNLRISDQRDFSVFDAPVDCLDCLQLKCKWGGAPKCHFIEPDLLANEINRRLHIYDPQTVSAVVCVYKPDKAKLSRCLEALTPQVNEIIIAADQASIIPDGVNLHGARVVRSYQHDIGYGRKANFGVRNAAGSWILFVNDDLYLAADAVQKMKDVAAPDVGVVGHLLRYPDGTIQHGGTGRHPNGKDWMHLDHHKVISRFTAPKQLEFVTGASILVRREAFYQAGGFDETFYLYCEDSDLCLSVGQKGWKVMYTPFATGIHEESQSTGKTPNMPKHMSESVVYFHSKWAWYLKKYPKDPFV